MTENWGNNFDEDRLLRDQKQRESRRDFTDVEKQFVRENGWLPAAQGRLTKVRETDRDCLRYFTLCAKLAIDVKHFYFDGGLLRHDGRGFPDVVFCERLQEEYEEIVRNLGRTRGFLANFEDLILKIDDSKSIDFYSELPFDVYNLDFTGMCFPDSEPPYSTTLESIVTLINIMGEERYQQGFDMFITFRAQESVESREAIRDLRWNITENRRKYGWFDENIQQRYGERLEGLRNRYHELLLISLPKYLGRHGNNVGFEVECTHRFCYPRPTIDAPRFHMVSFGLSFDWIGRSRRIEVEQVRQHVPPQERVSDTYLRMLEQLASEDIPNVSALHFPRDEFGRKIQELIQNSSY